MSEYLYADDGNIHTRFSELANCTFGSIERVLDEREGKRKKFENESTLWGSERHEMWAEEGRKFRQIPKVFHEVSDPLMIEHIEKEFATELLPGVIVHSRPDAVGLETVIDYKTLASESLAMGKIKATATYTKSRQLKFYAYQLGLHGIRIRQGIYLVEIWDKNYTEILGYHAVIQKYGFKELAEVLPWIKDRISLLVAAYEERMVEV